MDYFTSRMDTKVGTVLVKVERGGALLQIRFLGELTDQDPDNCAMPRQEEPCRHVTRQLEEYFAGEREGFDLELDPVGTPFQLRVWQELRHIPYGVTITYSELARRLGKPSAVRAVGRANSANPIPIVVPCHRVIGADGSLTGFAGGIQIKRTLLVHEGALLL